MIKYVLICNRSQTETTSGKENHAYSYNYCITGVIIVSALVQQSTKAMEGADITLQFHEDAKILPLISQLIEVSERSTSSPGHLLDFSAEDQAEVYCLHFEVL